jgi:hypothetical protein
VDGLEDVIRHIRPGEPVPGLDGIDSTDASGTVYCVVDVTGALLRVGIDDGWWDAVGPGRIAGAILDSMRFAKAKAAAARMVLSRHGHPVAGSTVDLGRIFTSEPSETLPAYDADDFPEVLDRKAERTMTILSRAHRFSRERADGEQRVVAGPRGMFRVVVAGGRITGAEVNEWALHRTDAAELAEDARAALQAARPPVGVAR